MLEVETGGYAYGVVNLPSFHCRGVVSLHGLASDSDLPASGSQSGRGADDRDM